MTIPPARGRSRGSGPFLRPRLRPTRRASGRSAIEILAIVTIGLAVCAAAVPGVANLQSVVSIRSAAGEVAASFQRARAFAITRRTNVGLKFRQNGDRYEWALYADGNGNGVRTREIDLGIDPPVGVAYAWMRNDVRPAILTGIRVPDPGSPGSFLDHPEDPIRFNSSDICSFDPLGESTPGSVYLWDGRDRMAVVRVFGRSGKIRTLYYRRGDRRWTQ